MARSTKEHAGAGGFANVAFQEKPAALAAAPLRRNLWAGAFRPSGHWVGQPGAQQVALATRSARCSLTGRRQALHRPEGRLRWVTGAGWPQ